MEKIEIKILFFGSLKQHYGNQMQMEIPKGLPLGELIGMLKKKSPEASEILTSCQVAVNSELENQYFAIHQPYEIAILPPFSGG